MSRGFTAHRRSCAATAASSAAPARQRVLGPLFMADDEKVDPEILAKVKSIVVSQLAVEESQVVPEANFTQDLGADSLDTVELIMALEEGFDIEIEDEVAAEISTVKQAERVSEQIAARRAGSASPWGLTALAGGAVLRASGGALVGARAAGEQRDHDHDPLVSWRSNGGARSNSFCPRCSSTAAVAEALRGGGKGSRAALPSKPTTVKGMLTATRPWSWTAGVIPVLLTGTLLHRAEGATVGTAGLTNALIMVITLQASGNLVNSYIDHNYGVDTVETAGDRTIVDAHVSPRGALVLAGVMFFAAVAAVAPTVTALRAGGAARELELTFWVGVGMVFSYTCWPFRLKYHGLGDITVFLLFGPMLMQVAAMLICGKVQHWVLPFGVPSALLCEAILHANNMRDIEQDRTAGISTLATTIGFRASQVLYLGMIGGAYVVAGVLALMHYKGSALAFLTLPLAISALKDCTPGAVRRLDEKTAKLHLLFGVLMTAGTLLF
eukprot:g5804.t1